MPSEESMIQDLRELEAELREKDEYRKANIIDLFIRYNTHCKIHKTKIKEKIEDIEFEIEKCSEESKNYKLVLLGKRNILIELLEGR